MMLFLRDPASVPAGLWDFLRVRNQGV